jgi:membrane protein implicated in regulation of membrane protease activity
MMKSSLVTSILMFLGLVALGIWQAAFQEGFSWAAWLDSWSFSFLSMLLTLGLFIGFGALLYAVIRRIWEPREETREESSDKNKIQKAV